MKTKHEWKGGIFRCLEEANNRGFTSVSFPALGTGTASADNMMFLYFHLVMRIEDIVAPEKVCF